MTPLQIAIGGLALMVGLLAFAQRLGNWQNKQLARVLSIITAGLFVAWCFLLFPSWVSWLAATVLSSVCAWFLRTWTQESEKAQIPAKAEIQAENRELKNLYKTRLIGQKHAESQQTVIPPPGFYEEHESLQREVERLTAGIETVQSKRQGELTRSGQLQGDLDKCKAEIERLTLGFRTTIAGLESDKETQKKTIEDLCYDIGLMKLNDMNWTKQLIIWNVRIRYFDLNDAELAEKLGNIFKKAQWKPSIVKREEHVSRSLSGIDFGFR